MPYCTPLGKGEESKLIKAVGYIFKSSRARGLNIWAMGQIWLVEFLAGQGILGRC